MMYKNFLFLLIVAALIATMAGCDDTNGTEQPAVKSDTSSTGESVDSLLQALNKKIADDPGIIKIILTGQNTLARKVSSNWHIAI